MNRRTFLSNSLVGGALATSACGPQSKQPALQEAPVTPVGLRIAGDPPQARVQVVAEDRPLLESPADGLWSIAMDWTDAWPAKWMTAQPEQVEEAGPWTVLSGRLDTGLGVWKLRDAYRAEGRTIRGVRRFEWTGEAELPRCTLSLRFVAPAVRPREFLPGILYSGNPSGARSGRVPVFSGRPGEEAFYEEHRFPMPFAMIEWEDGGRLWGAALHTVPGPVPFGNRSDQWWSLGLRALADHTELAALSGPCASNGERSVIKARQRGFSPYDDVYLNVPPGAIIEKSFHLEAYPVAEEGSAFQRAVHTSIGLFQPGAVDGLPAMSEIVRAKYRFAKSRWEDRGDVGGFNMYPDRDFFVMGWCGQAACPGYALQVLAGGLDDAEIPEMVRKSLDTLSDAPFYEGGFRVRFDHEKREWSGGDPVSQGQAMLNFTDAIRVGRESGAGTARWEEFVRRACDYASSRIMDAGWRPESTNEGFYVAPLCDASRLFDEHRYLEAARKAGDHYADRHLSMREPYWGGTLDASCEDKEGAYAAFQAFLYLYESTGEKRYLDWARHACDVMLSYLVVWDIDLPPGRLRDHWFRTRGWTAVSVQNQHIDAYAVLAAPYVHRLGELTGAPRLKQLAILMYRSCGQLIDPYGSHGEQPYHTNYSQGPVFEEVTDARGQYYETWTVFWLTAHFLNAAARFQELGVDVWSA